MRNIVPIVVCLGLAGPALAQSAPSSHAAPQDHHAPRSAVGRAMADLTRALHDAADQARQAPATATVDVSTGATTSRKVSDVPVTVASPQPTAQAAVP